jgi:hypothetical protein
LKGSPYRKSLASVALLFFEGSKGRPSIERLRAGGGKFRRRGRDPVPLWALSFGSISVAVAGTGVAIEGKVRVGFLWQVPSAR